MRRTGHSLRGLRAAGTWDGLLQCKRRWRAWAGVSNRLDIQDALWRIVWSSVLPSQVLHHYRGLLMRKEVGRTFSVCVESYNRDNQSRAARSQSISCWLSKIFKCSHRDGGHFAGQEGTLVEGGTWQCRGEGSVRPPHCHWQLSP